MNAHRIVIVTKTHRCAFHMAGVDTFHKAEAYRGFSVASDGGAQHGFGVTGPRCLSYRGLHIHPYPKGGRDGPEETTSLYVRTSVAVRMTATVALDDREVKLTDQLVDSKGIGRILQPM